MTSTTPKAFCATCNKGIGQFKCEGCLQTFCLKHVTEHRQTLSQRLDEVILEHDLFQQTIMEDKDQSDRLMLSIAQWEEKSIKKIQQLAKDIREEVNQLRNTYKRTVTQDLDQLRGQIKKAREEDDFFENDLQNWLIKLNELKGLKTAALSSDIREDQASTLICQIQIISPSLSSTPSSENKLHPRLQYTNQDGVYVNPKSFLVTPIWYFYSPTYSRWFWTPYENYQVWMPVDNLTVKSGHYKDQQPASINIEIIQYLRQHNPVPPFTIFLEASKAEKRILKL